MIRFGERPAGQHLSLGDLGQPFLPLVLTAEVQNELGGKIRDGHAKPHRGIPAAQLLADQDVFHDPQALAGIFFRKVNTDESQIRRLLPDGFWKRMHFYQIVDHVLFELSLDEIPNGFLNLLLFLCQLELH